jgi:GNAT superfamily N-acetyltransferase
MKDMRIRTITSQDRSELADLIYVSLNYWYQIHGRPPMITGGPKDADAFYEVYNRLDPGCAVIAENTETGRLMGSCFYHPRKHHVSLGIMNVHPNYFGRGVGRALLEWIIDFTEKGDYPALRLTQSALNLDSYSLYTRAGFVPRCAFQDMFLQVPHTGMNSQTPGLDRVREATLDDIRGMAELEMEVSGIAREQDYRYAIENPSGFFHCAIYEGSGGRIDGYMISSGCALNLLGPCVARSEHEAAALIVRELDLYRGRSPVFLIPVECHNLVRQMYDLGARNCELHFCQVRGRFQPFRGISMPSFLPETG